MWVAIYVCGWLLCAYPSALLVSATDKGDRGPGVAFWGVICALLWPITGTVAIVHWLLNRPEPPLPKPPSEGPFR